MKTISQKRLPSKSAGDSVGRLTEIQEQMRDLCQPHYDEFYRVQADHGFIKITVPRRRTS